MNKNDERFLIKVVDMYYNEEMSQEKIAKKLDVSRATISRALTKAKKEGLSGSLSIFQQRIPSNWKSSWKKNME
jgi:transposase